MSSHDEDTHNRERKKDCTVNRQRPQPYTVEIVFFFVSDSQTNGTKMIDATQSSNKQQEVQQQEGLTEGKGGGPDLSRWLLKF